MRLDRLNAIENFVITNGTASLEDITERFGISINTVRRDVSELIKRGNILKVYGGVTSVQSTVAHIPVISTVDRLSQNIEAKKKIGLLASSLVQDNCSIFLDSGSTTPHILQHIASKKNITVVTHSLNILNEASKYPSLQVVALGGVFSTATSSFFSSSSLETLTKSCFDMVFMAATAVSLEHGLTNSTYFEVEIKRLVTSKNQKIILMADQSKFGKNAFFTFYDFSYLYAVVTDKRPAPEFIDTMKKNNILLLYDQSPTNQKTQ